MSNNPAKKLENRMLYLRSVTDYKLPSDGVVIVMIDGHSFSTKVKKRFKLPFDEKYISWMNQTAEYVCKNVAGCKFAFTQSDEISFIIHSGKDSFPYFDNRLCKLQSLIASMASAYFNKLSIASHLASGYITNSDDVMNSTTYEFDAKAWVVPTVYDAYLWLLYRQRDCIRNSKQQAAQTYLSHKQLMGKHTDTQVALLKEYHNIDWNDYPDDQKYGRFIYRESYTEMVTYVDKRTNVQSTTECTRSRFSAHPAWVLGDDNSKLRLSSVCPFFKEYFVTEGNLHVSEGELEMKLNEVPLVRSNISDTDIDTAYRDFDDVYEMCELPVIGACERYFKAGVEFVLKRLHLGKKGTDIYDR